tara:strand:- start:3292 stop:3528 length:237 start_codon:yes stop_codon:yes gene_type:complete
MVRYVGRARQLTRGNCNQNLNMSGCAMGVGRSYHVLGDISRRVQAGMGVCTSSKNPWPCRAKQSNTAQATRPIGSLLF